MLLCGGQVVSWKNERRQELLFMSSKVNSLAYFWSIYFMLKKQHIEYWRAYSRIYSMDEYVLVSAFFCVPVDESLDFWGLYGSRDWRWGFMKIVDDCLFWDNVLIIFAASCGITTSTYIIYSMSWFLANELLFVWIFVLWYEYHVLPKRNLLG